VRAGAKKESAAGNKFSLALTPENDFTGEAGEFHFPQDPGCYDVFQLIQVHALVEQQQHVADPVLVVVAQTAAQVKGFKCCQRNQPPPSTR